MKAGKASEEAATTTPPVAARQDKTTVKMEGYLEKKGKMRVVGTWKRYWFVLEGRLLLYYKSQQEYARLSPCRGSLNMGLAACVRPAGPAGPDHHVLEVVLRSHVVALRAKDRGSQEQWLKALLDSMAPPSSSSTSPGKDGNANGANGLPANGKGPLHFRYPSADNLHKVEHESLLDEQDAGSTGSGRRDKAADKAQPRALPGWMRAPSAEPPLAALPEREAEAGEAGVETPEAAGAADGEQPPEDKAPKKGKGRAAAGLDRQGSILPILGRRLGSPRAVHPADSHPAGGGQRFSLRGPRKAEAAAHEDEAGTSEGPDGPVASGVAKSAKAAKPTKARGFKGFENVLRKQLSFSSPASEKGVPSPKDVKGTQVLEEVLKTPNGGLGQSPCCRFCRRLLSSDKDACTCQKMNTPMLEEEKENVMKWTCHQNGLATKFHPDENHNQLFRDSSLELKRMAVSLDRNCTGSDRDLLATSGVDLSFLSPDTQVFPKPIRCTSADELWSPPRKNLKEVYMKHSKFDHLGDAHYFSASDINHHSHTLESHMSEPVGSEKNRLVKVSLRQRLIHGNGEYIKYSEPEDCDKRDSTLNTTSDSPAQDAKTKAKVRLRKRKGSSTKDSYNLAENYENGNKKRAPVRNRMSFLTRVLSHVRRTKSEDVMDHPETEGIYSDDAFLSPHPDLNSKCTTPISRVLDDVKKIENALSESDSALRPNFQLGPTNSVFGEAPEEPPPDYDSVGVEPIVDVQENCPDDEPPQLPPRRMKRPRSPWHDVPTNNSPVVDNDSEARQRLLSAAKYGRVIGTRTSHSMDFYNWSESRQSDHSQHHAYEVVSDDTSPAGSNEHLAIYLSSESSDDEFHEEVVLRRSIEDRDFLYGDNSQFHPFGKISNASVMEPLTISTDLLPTLDSSGKVGLSHVEAMKLNLLMQAQKTSTETIRRQKKEREKAISAELKLNENDEKIFIQPESDECLQLPPEEFADKIDPKLPLALDPTENIMAEVQGLLSPVEKLIHSYEETNVACDKVIGKCQSDETGQQAIGQVHCIIPEIISEDLPPLLPVKKMKCRVAGGSEILKRNSDELNHLLAQLAGMTTAPLLPVGATCSLQMNVMEPEGDMMASHHRGTTAKKQSLSLEAVSNMYDSEPDYDVPRPHISLLHMLPHRPFLNSGLDDDEINVEATHFLSRPESPRRGFMDDQNWSGGHMSPDSLDFPFTSRHANSWDVFNPPKNQERKDTQKWHTKKDRSRRATLNGPITKPPLELSSPCHSSPLVRRNSIELPTSDNDFNDHLGIILEADRGMSEPKQVKKLSPYEVATCEHNSSPFSSLSQNYESAHSNMCTSISSLEDISEKSELNSEAAIVRVQPESSDNLAKGPSKPDDLDLDSLEVSEFRRVDVSSGTIALVSIIEEPDMFSDKSDYHGEGSESNSSGSASEGAVMIESSDLSGIDLQTCNNTDTDMEMPSDDESVNQKLHKNIEPDSLLQDSFVDKDLEAQSATVSDGTKDASLETDSLELKK